MAKKQNGKPQSTPPARSKAPPPPPEPEELDDEEEDLEDEDDEEEDLEDEEEEAQAAPAPASRPANSKRSPARAKPEGRLVHLRIKRQDGPGDAARWEEFKVPYLPQMNVNSALQQVQKYPETTSGQAVAPVVWEAACLEEVCGSCTMLINGRVRQACSSLVDQLAPDGQTITIEPMTKFPLIRDLVVDRGRMFEDLKRVKAWIELDGTHELGPGPRESQEAQEERYPLSRCMTCGSCLEACPQVNDSSTFIGPAALNQVRLFNLHPSGKMHKNLRLDAVMGEGGVADCGKAQNCVEVCPKSIPLVDSIASVSRDTTKRMLFGWLLK